MKIKIVSLMVGNLVHFKVSSEIMSRYCRRFGYEYSVYATQDLKDRHVNWSKVPCCLESLYDCDYLLYLDADAFFWTDKISVEERLLPKIGEKSVLVASDCGSSTTPWNKPDEGNSGVVLFRNDPVSKKFLSRWLNIYDENPVRYKTWPLEQIALNDVIKEFRNDVVIERDYESIQGLEGKFIRHLMLMKPNDRRDIIEKRLGELNEETNSVRLCFRR